MDKPLTLKEKKLIAMTSDMVSAIKDFRFQNRIETESEAIRELIRIGLEAANARDKQNLSQNAEG